MLKLPPKSPTTIEEWDEEYRVTFECMNGATTYILCLHETIPIFEQIMHKCNDFEELKSELTKAIDERKAFLKHIVNVP